VHIRMFIVYRKKNREGRRKVFAARANAAGKVSSCLAPSQHLLKPLLWRKNSLYTVTTADAVAGVLDEPSSQLTLLSGVAVQARQST
jgi:hypothetical protein